MAESPTGGTIQARPRRELPSAVSGSGGSPPGEDTGRSGGQPDGTQSVKLRSLSCPSCAGILETREGERIITCSHCGTPYLATSSHGFSRRFFRARVTKLEAVGRAAGWLSGLRDVPRNLRQSAFTDAQLLYVPVWEVRAHVVGWEFGSKRRTKSEVVRVGEQDAVQLKLVDEAVEQGLLDERRMYQEAADISALGMGRPHITGRDFTLPFLAGELEEGAAVLEPDRDFSEILIRARQAFVRTPNGAARRNSRLFLLKESVTLIYYPLWALRYRYQGRLYDVTVDGRNGAIHSGRAPADNTRRLALMVFSYALLALALALVVTLWQTRPLFREACTYAGALILALAGTVYWRFSLLREVEHHEPFSS